MVAEALGFVAGLEEPGFNGRGGGARSGSELSHLECFEKRLASFNKKIRMSQKRRNTVVDEYSAYIGTDERPESENEGWCLSTSSRSRDSSVSTEGIVANETGGYRGMLYGMDSDQAHG